MGTWNTSIKGNDASSDIYLDFFDSYNDGKSPEEISKKLFADYQEVLDNPQDCNNFWFALALAQWETKSLDEKVYKKVKEIIESGKDLKVWEELGADKKDIKKRKDVLDKFLVTIQTEKEKARLPKKIKAKDPIFKTGDCLTFKLKNGNFGGALVIGSDFESKYGYNLVASTRINQKEKPNLNDFEKADVLIVNYAKWDNYERVSWYLPKYFKKEYIDLFEIVGNIKVDKAYKVNEMYDFKVMYSGDWINIIEDIDRQFEHELTNKKPDKKLLIKEITKDKKWWKII
ncbi:hypothetical protein BRDCF_p1996 [Bacteroidales bacterium CF]|jgi:hypothetical protein|nr:hypothetical protein BRDCF_p1996 [Bacteroidales bacterium CF]